MFGKLHDPVKLGVQFVLGGLTFCLVLVSIALAHSGPASPSLYVPLLACFALCGLGTVALLPKFNQAVQMQSPRAELKNLARYVFGR